MTRLRPIVVALLLALGVAGLAACGGDAAGVQGGADRLTIYSGRQEKLVAELFERFENDTGVDVEVRYGDSAELAATIAEEGGNSPADVFFSQDAGALGAVAREGLLRALPRTAIAPVPARFRDPQRRWVGVSGRARVIAYNTDELTPEQLPNTVFGFVRSQWKGRVAIAPGNASFQAFVSAMRIAVGDTRTRAFLVGLKDNDVETYENNIAILEAIARGEVDVGLVNHYYLAEVKREQPDAPVANHFLRRGDPGSLVNVAGVGILAGADSRRPAERFVRFLLSGAGQRYFVGETDEYSLLRGVPAPANAPRLSDVHGPDIRLGDLGARLQSTLSLLDSVGLGA